MLIISELIKRSKRLPRKLVGALLLGITITVSIAIFFYFTPLETPIAGVALVNSNLQHSIPFKIIVAGCLLTLPLVFLLISSEKFFFNFKKIFSVITLESFVATLFLSQLVFQAKFSSSYQLAVKFIFFSFLFVILSLIFLQYFSRFFRADFFKFLINIYSLTVLASILYINFHAYNRYLLASYFYVLGGLVSILLCIYIVARKRLLPKALSDLTFVIPFWIILLFPSRANLLNLHPFESFSYSNLELLRKGFRPWQDFSLEHGIWEDLGRNWLGGILAGPSFWGQSSGIVGFVGPFEYLILAVLIYAICKNVYLSVGIILCLQYFSANVLNVLFPRMIPILALTVVLRQFFLKKTDWILIVLGLTMGIAMLWSYESLFGVISVWLVLILVFKSKQLTYQNLGLLVFAPMLLTILIPLLMFGVLDDWVLGFTSNTSGYLVAWAAGISLMNGPLFNFLLFFVPLCIMTLNFIIFREIIYDQSSKKSILWIAPALASVFIYYVKFLAWPDWHLGQSSSLLLLLLMLFWLSKLVGSSKYLDLQNNLKSISLVIVMSFSFLNFTGISPGNATVVRYADTNFDQLTNDYITRINDVGDSFLPYLTKGKNTKIFDFGNEPVTWYGILGFHSAGGDAKVLNILSTSSQARTVEHLKKNRPDAIIWGGEFGYFNWPAPGNSLRSYLISSHILKNYHPVVSNGGYTLLLPGRTGGSSASRIALSSKTACDWGDGNSRFIQPSTDQKILKTFSLTSNGIFFLNNKSKSLTIDSDVYGKFSLSSLGGFGEILFTLNPGANKVWLDGCPAWNYGKDAEWKLSGPDGNFVVNSKG